MASNAKTPNPPPDYISIPEPLKSRPVRGPYVSSRLNHLLCYAGVRSFGDLDGKRLSDFAKYRGCGPGTVWALRCAIFAALHPGLKPDLTTWPIPLSYYRPPEPTFVVPVAVRDLRLKHLPASARLENVLKGLGIYRLGQLHSLPVGNLRVARCCGRGTLAELGTLLRRAEAGEFGFPTQEFPPTTPADLPREIDAHLSRLPAQERALLLLRFGGSGQAPLTLRQIGKQRGVTGSNIGQHLPRVLAKMRRYGCLKLRNLLDGVESVCAGNRAALSPALVSAWQEPGRPFKYSPQFYARIIPKLLSAA